MCCESAGPGRFVVRFLVRFAQPQPGPRPLGARPQPLRPGRWRLFRWGSFPMRFAVRFRTSPKITPNKQQQPQPESRPEQAADQPESVGDPHKKPGKLTTNPCFSLRFLTGLLHKLPQKHSAPHKKPRKFTHKHLTEKNIRIPGNIKSQP